MQTIYVTSMVDFAGKTGVAIGLGKHLQRDGYVVGYMKPLATRVRRAWSTTSEQPIHKEAVTRDAEYVAQELGLTEPLSALVPIALTPPLIREAIENLSTVNAPARLDEAYAQVSQGKDILLLEGGGNPFKGSLLGLSSPQVAERLDAKVIVVVKYEDNLCIDAAAGLPMIYGSRVIGLVINAVPRPNMRFVNEIAAPLLEDLGLPVLAVLPYERLLSSVTVRALVDNLEGRVVCCNEGVDALVEYMMIGAMTAGSALTYFRQRPNKAVITGGDRHDVQLAALETSTRCLILTGGQEPSPVVLERAQEVGVPIVVVESDTMTTMRMVEPIFGHTALHEDRKGEYFDDLVEERLDFARLYQQLGLER